jgi:hypothetical protein
MDRKYSLLTGSIGVRSKHIYTQSTGRHTCFVFWYTKIHFSRWRSAILNLIWEFSLKIIVTSLAFPSWHLQFITSYRTHSDLISTVCIKLIHRSIWRVKCLQQWKYTEHNAFCLKLTDISFHTILCAVCLNLNHLPGK